ADGLRYRAAQRDLRVDCRVQAGHEERGARALARHVAERDDEATVVAEYEVVVVAADLVRGEADALKLEARDGGRRGRQEALLNLARQLQLALEALLFEALCEEPRVLDADGGDRAERRQNLQVIFGEA